MLRLNDGNYFSYEMIGEFRSNGEWIHPQRTINSYELILVKSGTLYLQEDDTVYTLCTDDMILLEPHKIHGGYKPSNEKISFYWLHFYTNLSMPFKTSSGKDMYDIRHLIKKLLNSTNGGYCSQNTADTIAYLIFDELSRPQEQLKPPIQNITEYIRINRNKDISISEIAEEFGYNPDYLGKLFKRHTKIGLKDYIASQRLAFAKELLLSTSLSVKEIAVQTGCNSENLFTKFFIYHEKITPTAFRNRYINTHLNNK